MREHKRRTKRARGVPRDVPRFIYCATHRVTSCCTDVLQCAAHSAARRKDAEIPEFLAKFLRGWEKAYRTSGLGPWGAALTRHRPRHRMPHMTRHISTFSHAKAEGDALRLPGSLALEPQPRHPRARRASIASISRSKASKVRDRSSKLGRGGGSFRGRPSFGLMKPNSRARSGERNCRQLRRAEISIRSPPSTARSKSLLAPATVRPRRSDTDLGERRGR